jgi:hypothetical protein
MSFPIISYSIALHKDVRGLQLIPAFRDELIHPRLL